MIERQSVTYIYADDESAGRRIDNFLQGNYKIPKTLAYRIIRKGEVRVNQKRVSPDYRLVRGDKLRIPPLYREPSARLKPQTVEKFDVDSWVLYEDDSLMVLNKPYNLPVHAGSSLGYGLIDVLTAHRHKDAEYQLVHRLDKETSGCLLIAKKNSVLRFLHEAMRENKIEKRYTCLVQGHWPKRCQKIELPLEKNVLRSGERMVAVSEEGKMSVTLVETQQFWDNATLLNIQLKTGRTHQIRVHTQYMKHPVAGDPKYGDKAFNTEMKKFGLNRLFLHAAELKFTHPSGEKMVVQAPLDPALEMVLQKLSS